MKRIIASIVVTFVAAGVPFALAYTSPGSPSGYVNDFAHVLSAGAKQALETELTSFEQATSNEISVVTVADMGGDYIENYAVKLFAEWGIGKKDRDNGVLLLLSIKEHKMRIEVGYGLEGALPDGVAQSILNNEMTPKLKAGDYDGAVASGVQAIEQATKGEYTPPKKSSFPVTEEGFEVFYFIIAIAFCAIQFLGSLLARSRSWWAGGVVGFLGGSAIGTILGLSLELLFPLIIGLTALGSFFDYIVSKGYQRAKTQGVTPPWWTGGSGSSGGGFGGFGGGSSGGGGASGGW